MKQAYKKKRLLKIVPILEQKQKEEIEECGVPKSHSLNFWLQIINDNLPPQDRIRNINELVSVFRSLKYKFKITTENLYLCCGDYKSLKICYKVLKQ